MKSIINFLLIMSLIGSIICEHHSKKEEDGSREKQHGRKIDSKVKYTKAAIPAKIFHCMHKQSLMRCMKLLMLARMESTDLQQHNTGNATTDFVHQIIESKDDKVPYNYHEVYASVNDSMVNIRLLKVFQKFFEGREIALHFIPGMIIKVVPSQNNLLQFSIKDVPKNVNEGRQVADTKDNSNKKDVKHYMELGAPALVLPAILFSSVLPFMIPTLKMATLFAGMINNAALMAGILYLARQAALETETKSTVYFNPGYSRNGWGREANAGN